jgi:hypothetical protein
MKTLSILVFAIVTNCFFGCEPQKQTKKLEGELMHTVLFWLAEGADEQAFMNGSNEFLKSIREVKTFYVGTPAMTPRDVVDNSYSVYITMTFEKKEDLKTYLEHPAHLAYLDVNKANVDKILVYDVLNR